jgi:hypothetical protein
MPGLITMSTILSFCFSVAGEFSRSCVCFISLFMVMAYCVFHFSDGINWILRYT